jgi:hypothetical protein
MVTALLRAALAAAAGAATMAQSAPPAANGTAALPPLVQRYCAECHGDPAELGEGGFELAPLFAAAVSVPAVTADRVADVVQRLRSRTMPPPDAPQPNASERRDLVLAFAALAPADADAREPTVRRLTRTEYGHTVRAVCGIDWRGEAMLPDDASAHGFTNQGDVQHGSPLAFELWYDAATTIAAAVLAAPAASARAFADGVPLGTTLPPFLARAFRRPPSAFEVQARVRLHDDLLAAGRAPAVARDAVLRSIFASPAFLYRTEAGRPEAPHRLTAHELAVRLAYLLTAGPPDDALQALAAADALDDPAVLAAEARRLVAATGGRRLADEFAAQWLRFRDVISAAADFRRYPEIWQGDLRPSFYDEVATFFAAMAVDDAPVTELLDSTHTFVNARLAQHYGLPAVEGAALRRVTLPDRRRGGLLGMGAILFSTSYPLRTSPVKRGAYVLAHLLGTPPPPPPGNAGTLPADDQQPDQLTPRQRLERHRQDRGCAGCHAAIDPLGFALENYDVLGRWRTDVHGQPIDRRSELPDGTALDGPEALKDALSARREDFVRTFAEHLLVYAIGRPLVLADEAALADIVSATLAQQARFGALLTAVVTSPLFTTRIPAGAPR